MSTTYSLLCHDCRKRYWAGQSDWLYSKEGVSSFLHDHQNHRLEFVNDHTDRPDDDMETSVLLYEEWEPTGAQHGHQ